MLSYQTVKPDTLELLKQLMQIPLFSSLRLVGGTALALQYGHRSSVDLDLFGQLERNTALVTEALFPLGDVVVGSCSEHIKNYWVNGVKIDFVDYSRYPWLDDAVEEDLFRLASPRDIAAMKINAIEGRGSRKDFVDIYFLLQHYSLKEIMDYYARKYPEHSSFRAMLSLAYFDDAEAQPMPEMFNTVQWEEIKRFILKAVEEYNASF